jgi:membrane-bound metal-dependent hydrolase YbcI (DUF457 family)
MKKLNILASYPQNYIIRNPFYGTLILFIFYVLFLCLYQPLNSSRSQMFNFEITMALYSAIASISAYFTIRLLKLLRPFSKENKWTIIKEIIFIYLVLQLMGIVSYFAAFAIEETSWEARWNISTFLDSCKYAFYVGIFPFAFFTLSNYNHLLAGKPVSYGNAPDSNSGSLVNIVSNLKKESLSFHSDELLFVSSEGNYVDFHLYQDNKQEKITIRNSISDIEKQFADIPYYFRCHRAFIVNLNFVQKKKGNTLGYRLKVSNCKTDVLVSRKYVKSFDQLYS